MFDLDDRPAYVGRSSNLYSRLRQHFVRQDSSVVSYGRLDIWDISHVDWWSTEKDKISEKALLAHHSPYLNFGSEREYPDKSYDINLENPDGTVELLAESEQEFRSIPYNRSKQKLEHLSRMVDKIKYAGHSADTRKTLLVHQEILQENLAEFLDLDGTQ
ncbi:hypothetical protein AUR64_03880 [Haloprofundus marisrubri]|uniref:GIY-YIG domain-containing protein n=1 Tax=Haloprofundus marisrubri TaxID=1514971 RepID=A0A0W1RDR9_9EURY|nr:hypothetical protein AUR64_03880 [Haloprofundus marisrubri]